MTLNEDQNKQLEAQFELHKHDDYTVDIEIVPGKVLENFSVHKNVFRPEITSALQLTRYLFMNNGLYIEKSAIGIGSGTGIQGITMALSGAEHVTMSDINKDAVKNTQENVDKFSLSKKTSVVQGDLFESIKTKAACIVFNHPFFTGEPSEDKHVSHAMLASSDLIHRFLEDAKEHLEPGGVIVMPYLHIAGKGNNPESVGPEHGYAVAERFRTMNWYGVQKGNFSIFELRLSS